MPTPVNRSGLRHVLSVAKVFISLDPSQLLTTALLDLMPSTGHLPVEGCGPQRTKDRGQEGDIIGLSYSTVVAMQVRINNRHFLLR